MRVDKDEITIREADFPRPFRNGLEFNAPVHGTWNIVHIGMQMPEAVQIYVCAKNCLRGVILTAAEMGVSDRFSFVVLEEKEIALGRIEETTIRGVIDVIAKRLAAGMPTRAVQVFTVCVHHFLGVSYRRMYEAWEKAYPQIDFYRCYMDPIMQKKGLTPDQKLRRAMFEKLPVCEPDPKTIAVLGSDFPLEDGTDLCRFAAARGWTLLQSAACSGYDEFLGVSRASVFIAVYPPAKVGVEQAAGRLGRKFLYLPACFGWEETLAQLLALEQAMAGDSLPEKDLPGKGLPESDLSEKDLHEKGLPETDPAQADPGAAWNRIAPAAERLLGIIGKTPVCIDYTAHPRPLGLARLLSTYGFHVEKVYLDVISPEEEADFFWLQEHLPDLVLSATIHVGKRHLAPAEQVKKLAIGQKAAYFEQTPFFVNMVEGFGLQGADGILRLFSLMEEAFETEKDLRDVVPRKGLGCESCFI